ncbi:hypothetical protein L211DRAFT_719055 [Terfezia boudieri ATCC MYA-4762]|uniref:Uncharacterized protein n=1 Tax=Terfezia boudieri ATCC MYA-4762 TaxID=1051890 RepID=A0A3N4L6V1_9PEZI|nr:hypothetical protein L211DRAFT_719055 [Terfezia boudieri ATCC MYA-4762]
MATYTIKVINGSTARQEFMLFNAQPALSSSVGKAYTNVWVKSPSVMYPHGHATFVITDEDFAVCGTTPQALANGVVVTTGDYQAVSVTGSSPGTKAIVQVVDGGPGFTPATGTTTLANSFAISVEPYNPIEYPNVYCGYGKYDSNNQVVPVTVWSAAPNMTYEITPNITYYIGTGDYKQGTTVDVTTIGPTCKIDFTKAPQPGMTVATTILNNENVYSDPVFSYPADEVPGSS